MMSHQGTLMCSVRAHIASSEPTRMAVAAGRLQEPGHIHSLAAGQLLEQLLADGVQVSRASACARCADLRTPAQPSDTRTTLHHSTSNPSESMPFPTRPMTVKAWLVSNFVSCE